MNNHYIPRLLLRQFATGEKVNSYDFIEKSFKTKKLRNTFAAKDLFDSELESLMASRIEGPIGNLLNNKLLQGRKITINRKENLLLRKFLMINYLRSPIINCTWDESVERTCSKEHPSVQTVEFLSRNYPGFKSIFGKSMSSDKTYIRDLKKAMAYDSLEDICDPANELDIPVSLEMAAKSATVTTIAFWDCENTEQEFIMPKLQGISIMDQVSNFYKVLVINERKKELEKKGVEKISSKDLSVLIGYTASQIRQDLNNFGGFGQQGYGYSVTNLHEQIGSILGLDKTYKMVIVGYGRLGQAMASYISNNEPNFHIVGIFDVKQIIQDVQFKDAQIMTCGSLRDFVEKENVDIAVITVPSAKAQLVADTVVDAGIKGIWNLTAVDLDLPENIAVENVHMSDSLHALVYYMGDTDTE